MKRKEELEKIEQVLLDERKENKQL